MLRRFVTLFGGKPHQKELEKLLQIVARINACEQEYEALSDDALRARSDDFRRHLARAVAGIQNEAERRQAERVALEEILPQAFAAVREASKRTIGLRHYDVQLIGGIVLHQGKIAEMRTGEGKTLVATLPLYLNALPLNPAWVERARQTWGNDPARWEFRPLETLPVGRGVHLVTVNDYLARRDARWMGPIYQALGMTVGILQMAAVTENGQKAFLYDPSRQHAREDQHQMRLVDRREAYAADITYGTNSEFGFDYLRDNMAMRLENRVQRGHHYAIVDEVDNVLIDEARTPLIISGPASEDVGWYVKMAQIVRQLRPEDYEVNERDRTVTLTEVGTAHVEQLLGQPLRDPDRPEDVTPEQARLLGYLEQALRAQHLFHRNRDYLVQGGKVIIVDEFTGRLMPGRRWSDGLHQAVEAKEGVRVEPENVTYATITLQNYFRMYEKLAGMSGTALTEAEEFSKIYNLEVMPIPTNLEYQTIGPNAPLVEVRAKDEEGFEYTYFARRDDPEKRVVFWRRKDYPDVIYRTLEAKLRAITREIVREHVRGRPVLVGTSSVENSERLSSRLRAEPIRRLMQVLLLRHAWLEAHALKEDGRAIPALQPLNRPLDQLRPEDLRPFARELGLSLNPEEPANLTRLLTILRLSDQDTERLKAVLQGGVPHQVLNARKHAEESQIIAGAGAFGAVTIATNMAGRGVDIKLGGELAEEILTAVNRVLRRAGYHDPYDMSLPERYAALQTMDAALYGIYETEVKFFLRYYEDMLRVRELGGLHIIGSERHEARRVDNQLRGRAARQGDPGSSRFYLSLEDDLMRLFGGEQVKAFMERFNIDDDYPLQARLVSNAIEQAQHRVEGANFDIRKHLLEYDDVLNKQRNLIYSQRNRVFEKEDLTEDVNELLRQEVQRRVQSSDAAGERWRLLAWLEQIQPPSITPQGIFPSFTYKILLDELNAASHNLSEALLDLAARALDAENAHLHQGIQTLLDRAGEDLESQREERLETLQNFLDSLAENAAQETRRPSAILEELNQLLRLPLRLSPDQLRLLLDDPPALQETLAAQTETLLTTLIAGRLLATLELRLGESLGLNAGDLPALTWEELRATLEERCAQVLAARRERLLGAEGQIRRDLAAALERLEEDNDQSRLHLLGLMSQGTRLIFDARTHQQKRLVFTRLHYTYLAADLLAEISTEDLAAQILEHLTAAQEAQRRAFGETEYQRLRQSGQLPPVLTPEAIGRRIQTQIYRQVLLGAMTELWVDYLTRVEALRVSIGLEAYAQRDPLVQYKSQASEMFQNLLADIRAAVIGRIFLYQPQVAVTPAVAASSVAATQAAPAATPTSSGNKRKRHRR